MNRLEESMFRAAANECGRCIHSESLSSCNSMVPESRATGSRQSEIIWMVIKMTVPFGVP